MSDELYYQKYLKYKAKYMELKYGGEKKDYIIYTIKSLNELATAIKLRDQKLSERHIKLINKKMIKDKKALITGNSIYVIETYLSELEKILLEKAGLLDKAKKAVVSSVKTVTDKLSSLKPTDQAPVQEPAQAPSPSQPKPVQASSPKPLSKPKSSSSSSVKSSASRSSSVKSSSSRSSSSSSSKSSRRRRSYGGDVDNIFDF